MNKEDLADAYVNEKSNSMKSLIKDAFLKGFEYGVLNSSLSINIDDVEFIDLGLPSGTLWSSCPLWHCNYGYKLTLFSLVEAKKLGIPNVSQWNELLSTCRFKDNDIISPNGMRIGYRWAPNGHYKMYTLGENCKEDNNLFWLDSDIDSSSMASAMLFDNGVKGTRKHFTGYKLPVFLVKNRH